MDKDTESRKMKWSQDEIWELLYHADSNWDTSPPDWETVADIVNSLSDENNNRTPSACKSKYYKIAKDRRITYEQKLDEKEFEANYS